MAIKISGTTVIDDNKNLTSINTTATGNTTITGFANVSTSVNANSFSVGTAFTANSTVVNAVSYYSGTLLVANTTVINATHLAGYTLAAPSIIGSSTANGATFTYANVSGQVNTATMYVATSVNVASVVQLNTTGIITTANIGIGTVSPTTPLNIYNATAAQILVEGDSAATSTIGRSSTDASSGSYFLRKSRGTVASKTAVANGDVMGALSYQAFGGTNFRTLSRILGYVDTYTSDTDISSYLAFFTTPSGSITATERVRIDRDGNVGIGNTAPAHKLRVTGTTSLAGAVSDITTLAAGNTTITGFANVSGNGQFSGNVGIGVAPTTTSTFKVNGSVASDISALNGDFDIVVTNTSLSTQRNYYGLQSTMQQLSQNKTAAGAAVASDGYGVFSGIYNGNTTSGGDARLASATGSYNTIRNYANGSQSNTIGTATGVYSDVKTFSSGGITIAYGVRSTVGAQAANATVNGAIGTAYGYQTTVGLSNSNTVITTGYLFNGSYPTSANVTQRWGIYISGEDENYFSANVGINNTAPTDMLSVNGTTYLGGAVSGITTLAAGNTTVSGFVNSTSANSGSFTVGTSFTANSTVVNAVSYNVGTRVIANSTVTNATHLNGVAAASYVNTSGDYTISGDNNFTGNNQFSYLTNGQQQPVTGITSPIQIHDASSTFLNKSIACIGWGTTTGAGSGAGIYIGRSKPSVAGIGSYGLVADNDRLAEIRFVGSNSSALSTAAQIIVNVDGAPAGGAVIPSEMLFQVSNTSVATTTRMAISGNGNIGIGTTTPADTLDIVGSATISTNSFTLGTSTNAAAGYTILPNNFKMNWGSVVANSTGANVVTFASAFTTNTYGLSLTIFGANSAVGTVVKANTISRTGFTVVCGNTTALNNTNISSVYYMAIGPA